MIKRQAVWLMRSGYFNMIAGSRHDTPLALVAEPAADDFVMGYIVCNHATYCCSEHGTHATDGPHKRCILR